MMGLSNWFHNRLLQLRADELELSTRFRWLLVYINGFCEACFAEHSPSIHTSGCDSRRHFLDQVAAGVERCRSLHFAVYKSSRHAKRREADRAEATRQAEAELSRQTGDVDCYKIYLKSMGLPVVTATLIFVIISVAADKMPQIWLRLWTQHGTTSTSDNLSYMGGYVAFIVLSMIGGVVNIAFFAIIGIPKSAKRLHAMLLAAVIQAPFHFFTCTDNGLTPFAFIATVAAVVQAIAETAIIASGSSYIGAILPVCFVAVYLVQHYYLKTSRQVRILDLEMKSPLYTQFTETLAGLSTIRAFGWTMAVKEENFRRLNTSQRPYYTMFCIQRWLQVILDLCTAGMALVLVIFAVMFPRTTSNGAIGLAMVNIISFEFTLSMLITQWTQLETSLGAITRLKWFIKNTPSENKPQENQEPPPGWPSRGLIELDNVTAAYKDGADPVLLGVSLTIEPGQKVGICGRSGSGKSSLVATLARLLELKPGSTIRIDGVNLATIPRQTIRSRLISLPQDALRLAGTVRHNLDPEQSIQADEALIEALTKTAIWPYIETKGGLEAKVEDLRFSAGQLQLFCLARVVLRHGRAAGAGAVILLGEATSSVDRRTDDQVRDAISANLDGRTVIEVAHRLDITRHYDVIVIMAEGRVVETGPPDELLAQSGSEFAAMWARRGL
ncbi:ABC transporter, transmembrane domain, type 1, partial [Metarhizium majus ARSEF 297]